MNNRFIGRLVLGVSVFFAVFIAGCSADFAGGRSGPYASLDNYYAQNIKWESCKTDMFIDETYFANGFSKDKVLCTKVKVPASYSDLELGLFNIQLMKLVSNNSQAGNLFLNPGGPGGSGVEFVQYVQASTEVRDNFNLVGFDPRGVGYSDEIRCDDKRHLAGYYQFNFYVNNEEEGRKQQEFTDKFEADCAKANPLWWTVNTENTVRDLDILREVVDGGQLIYSGTSYGTTIGVEYLRLFGENAGKLIFDSPTENNLDMKTTALNDLESIEASLRALFEKCAEDRGCYGETAEEVAAHIRNAIVEADKGNLTGVYGVTDSEEFKNRTIGSGVLLFDGVFNMTYYPILDIYTEFKLGMNELRDLDYPIFEWHGLSYHGYDPETKKRSNSDEILNIVNCLDSDRRYFDTEEQMIEFEYQIAEVAPLYYSIWQEENDYVYTPERLGCGWSWMAFDDPNIPNPPKNYLDPVNETGKEFLVFASRLDSVTPYSGAVNTAKFLRSRLVTAEGDTHGVAFNRNSCINRVVADYLIRDILPAEGFSCG